MGWNTWNKYGCNIDEQLVLNAAKSIASNGLKDLGYNYVIIDDCWQQNEREKKSKELLADSKKFPRGMKALVDDIHKMGLKVGIYSSAGTLYVLRTITVSECRNLTLFFIVVHAVVTLLRWGMRILTPKHGPTGEWII